MTSPTQKNLRLPINSSDVLSGVYTHGLRDELHHGNGDLIAALDALGLVGPFTMLTPWEMQDTKKHQTINAGGYAAIPFGDRYPPLINFVREFLETDKSIGLPQQSASHWRGALATNLVALLTHFAPSHRDSRVFFSNSGAEAIETAIKFVKAARPKAKHIINFKGAYHGKTFGALALTPNPEYQDLFRPLMDGVVTLPYGDANAVADTIKNLGAKNIAAVFVEPVQGEAGVIAPNEQFLPALEEMCKKNEILIVADEIQTGLGRSGHWFASIAGGLEPDIITLAKPLGGGMVAIGATIARRKIFARTLAGFSSKRHSNTFGGNSFTMAVGLRSLEILIEENLPARSKQLGEIALARLKSMQQKHPQLLEAVRGQGLLLALQFQSVLPPRIVPGLEELVGELSGLLGLRSLYVGGVTANASLSSKRVVRLTPALTMPDEVFERMLTRIEAVVERHPKASVMLRRTPIDGLYRLGRLGFK